jgi:hypothetical protein
MSESLQLQDKESQLRMQELHAAELAKTMLKRQLEEEKRKTMLPQPRRSRSSSSSPTKPQPGYVRRSKSRAYVESLSPAYSRGSPSPPRSSSPASQRRRSPTVRRPRSLHGNSPSSPTRRRRPSSVSPTGDYSPRSPPTLYVLDSTTGHPVRAPTHYSPDPDAGKRAQQKTDADNAELARNQRFEAKALAERSSRKQRERDSSPLHWHGSPDRMPTDRFGFADRRYAMSQVHGRIESEAHAYADRGVGQAPDGIYQALPRRPPHSPPRPRPAAQPAAASSSPPTRQVDVGVAGGTKSDVRSYGDGGASAAQPRSSQPPPDRMVYSNTARKNVPARFIERRDGYSFYSYRVGGEDRIKRVRDATGTADPFSRSFMSARSRPAHSLSAADPECETCLHPHSLCTCRSRSAALY